MHSTQILLDFGYNPELWHMVRDFYDTILFVHINKCNSNANFSHRYPSLCGYKSNPVLNFVLAGVVVHTKCSGTHLVTMYTIQAISLKSHGQLCPYTS